MTRSEPQIPCIRHYPSLYPICIIRLEFMTPISFTHSPMVQTLTVVTLTDAQTPPYPTLNLSETSVLERVRPTLPNPTPPSSLGTVQSPLNFEYETNLWSRDLIWYQ